MLMNSRPALTTPPFAVLLLAIVMAACGEDAPGPQDVVLPFGTLRGRVVTSAQTNFADVTARVIWGFQNLTAIVQSDGSFDVEIVDAVSGFGMLTIEPGSNEPMHPGWILLSPGDVGANPGTVVLAPKTWTLDSGDYAGIEVPIDPELAADGRVMPSFWGFYFPFSKNGFLQTVTDNTEWAAEFRGWPPDAFPIPVALDRLGSDGDITAADSVAFWEQVEVMEAALGWDAFAPAPLDEIRILGGTRRPADAIIVQLDASVAIRGVGVINRADVRTYGLSADATMWSGTRVRSISVVSADITYGIVRLESRELFSDRQLVIHELMHVLGAGHGCSWASVQTYCASLQSDVPTPPDVAHLAVMMEMRALELEHDSRWGILASVFGHRVVTLGLTPVPAIALTYGPSSAPTDWYRSGGGR
jgi:hypothetical protein